MWTRGHLSLACTLIEVLTSVWLPVKPATAAAAEATISTFAGGTGEGRALDIPQQPDALATSGSTLFIVDGGVMVRALENGMETTVAGSGVPLSCDSAPCSVTGDCPTASTDAHADGCLATNAMFGGPLYIAADAGGDLVISDWTSKRIRFVCLSQGICHPNGLTVPRYGIMTVAGDGCTLTCGNASGCSPDPPATAPCPATSALLQPGPLAVDAAGDIFVADSASCSNGFLGAAGTLLRKIDATGTMTALAGVCVGTEAASPPSGSAATLFLQGVAGLTLDTVGDLFISDYPQSGTNVSGRVVEIPRASTPPRGSTYLTVVGSEAALRLTTPCMTDDIPVSGSAATLAQPCPALAASLHPGGLAMPSTDFPATGTVGDGLLMADPSFNCVRQLQSGSVMTVAGRCGGGGSFADGAATLACTTQSSQCSSTLSGPSDVASDASGDLYIADTYNERVRFVCMMAPDCRGGNLPAPVASGAIATVAGNGTTVPFSGDGGPARGATLSRPQAVARDATGSVFIADTSNNRVRKVDAQGVITTVVGGGQSASGLGDGGPATSAALNQPSDVIVDGVGNVDVADSGDDRVRFGCLQPSPCTRYGLTVSPGQIMTVAGNGSRGYSGDGGPASRAELALSTGLASGFPGTSGIAVSPTGDLLLADTNNCRVRKVDSGTGVISTVAGTGGCSYGGDSGAATGVNIDPMGIAVDGSGNLFIAGVIGGAARILRVDTSQHLVTFAGGPAAGYSGDGGPATSARFSDPFRVAVDPVGTVYVADAGNNRIRRIWATGIGEMVMTVAGDGAVGCCVGDGGPASKAMLGLPMGMALDPGGDLLFADQGSNRIRKVSASAPPPGIPPPPVRRGQASAVLADGVAVAGRPLPLGGGVCDAGPISTTETPTVHGAGLACAGTLAPVAGVGLGTNDESVGPQPLSPSRWTARSRLTSVSVLPGAFDGKDLLDADSLDAMSSVSCTGGRPSSRSSIGSLVIAGQRIATQPVGSRVVFNPTGKRAVTLYGNPVSVNPTGARIPLAIVTLNYSRYDPARNEQAGSPVEVEFPQGGPLSAYITGRIFLSYAKAACA